MSNLLYPGLRGDDTDIRVYDALVRARVWRARAIRQGFGQLVEGLKGLARLGRRWHARRAAHADLMAMDQRQLDDIGLARSEIHDAVYGRQVANGEALGRGLMVLGRRLAEWRRRQLARQELQELDDRTLSDIGLRRGDIEAAIRGAVVPGQGADNQNQRPAANQDAPRRAA